MSQLTVYSTQLASAVLMALLLAAFSRRFPRPYVLLWSLSFAALALHVAGMGFATWARARWGWPVSSPAMIATTLTYTSAGALQILALLAGLIELLRPSAEPGRRWTRVPVLLVLALAVGALLTLPWAWDPAVNLNRLYLRTGTRYLLGGIALGWAAVLVLRHSSDGNFGRRLTAGVLGLYAAELLLQAVVALPVLWGEMSAAHRAITPVHGLFEVVVYPMLGIGLVIWLLITEHQRLDEAELRLQAVGRSDPVTGLANEQGLQQELAGQVDSTMVVGLLGLDQFRLINEARGMRGGDEVLQRVAQHLRRELPEALGMARLGGDEFVLVLPSGQASVAALERARASLSRGAGGPDQGLLAASLGWTRLAGIGDLRGALARAGTALRVAKQDGGGSLREFADDMAVAQRDWVVLSAELEQAFQRDEFVLFLQPLVSAGRGELTSFEALLRWRHPRRGVLPPDQFLPSLRTLRQMQRLDTLVLEQAARLLQAQAEPRRPIAVNLGVDSLLAPGMVEFTESLLRRHGLRPDLLHIEITEETAIRSVEQGVQVLERLQRLGIEIALDDFGTGYSSLTYLTRFPARRIKFDRQFLTSAAENASSRAVLAALVPLVRRLGLSSVAEGVETLQQRELAENLGFDELQGYLFGRPQPAAEVLAGNSPLSGTLRLVAARPENH